jgi:hypothetical protein
MTDFWVVCVVEINIQQRVRLLLLADYYKQRREERRGREQRATRRATDATGHKIATQHTKPQGFIIRPPLLTTNKVSLC